MNKVIYLDNNATTKVDPRVIDAMLPFFTEKYSNASSNHTLGSFVNNEINVARGVLAELIGADRNEIVFTSGATEAINLALKGVAENYKEKGKHIITVKTEHSAVLDVCKYLETKGYEITYLPVDKFGIISLDQLRTSLRPDTILISVMFVNNEIGIIQPVKEIAEIAHHNGSIFMTDATQAFGKITINVNDLGVDLMSFSGHKIYGPKGIGALYIRSRGQNKVKIQSLLHGGGHERGLRSGTLNTAGIIGMSKAIELAVQDMDNDKNRIMQLRDYLETHLLKMVESYINGHRQNRIYNTTNICFIDIDADAMITGLKNVAVSNGSACTSTSIEPSHVLKALGRSDEEAFSSIRFSLGRFNNFAEIKNAINEIEKVITKIKLLSTK